jgi:pSer/pThr/pTyr-binding forkhead associated (FHA) protein
VTDETPTLNLAAAGSEIALSRAVPESLRDRLERVAALLAALAEPPVEPSLVFRQPGRPTSVQIPIGEGVTVGRAEGCEIRLPDLPEMSRRHFAVTREGSHFVARDVKSANGIRVNENATRVLKRELRDGDLISAGGVIFLFTDPRKIDP